LSTSLLAVAGDYVDAHEICLTSCTIDLPGSCSDLWIPLEQLDHLLTPDEGVVEQLEDLQRLSQAHGVFLASAMDGVMPGFS
jgi:hypothetical protein